jgi:hypothetical protein
VAKAEQLVTHGKLNDGEVDDASKPASTLWPALNINDECAKVQLALDALSLVFGEIDMLKVQKPNMDKLSIGFEFLGDKALQQELELDYNERNKIIVHAADQWKMALLDCASERSGGRQRHQFKTVYDALPTDLEVSNVASMSRKQKAASTHHAKYSHKICCIEGCQGNNLNAKLIHVCDSLSELPINASCTQQITYLMKQFMQREHTD